MYVGNSIRISPSYYGMISKTQITFLLFHATCKFFLPKIQDLALSNFLSTMDEPPLNNNYTILSRIEINNISSVRCTVLLLHVWHESDDGDHWQVLLLATGVKVNSEQLRRWKRSWTTHTHLMTYPEGEDDDDPKEDEWKECKWPSLSKTLLLQPVQ